MKHQMLAVAGLDQPVTAETLAQVVRMLDRSQSVCVEYGLDPYEYGAVIASMQSKHALMCGDLDGAEASANVAVVFHRLLDGVVQLEAVAGRIRLVAGRD